MAYREMGIGELHLGTVEKFLGIEEEKLEDKPSLLRTVPGYEVKKKSSRSRSKSKSKKSKNRSKSRSRKSKSRDKESRNEEDETHDIEEEQDYGEAMLGQRQRLRANVQEMEEHTPAELTGVSDESEEEAMIQVSTESSTAISSYDDLISVGSNSLDGYDQGDTCTDIFMKTFPFLGLKEAVVKMTVSCFIFKVFFYMIWLNFLL